MPKCEHGLTSKECYVCASPKHGAEPVQEPEGGGALPPTLREPEEFDYGIGSGRFQVVRGAYWWHILIGDSPIKRGKFHTQAGAEEMAALLLREFRNGAFTQHKTAPAKPVQEPVALKHRHEWFRTGGMEPGQFRCIHCGVWGQEQADPQIADHLARHGIQACRYPNCVGGQSGTVCHKHCPTPCPDCRGLGYDASGQTCWCQQNPSF